MALSEFDLIRRYFSDLTPLRDDVALGIGDDCALLDVPEGMELAVSIDTLVAGVHFLADVEPETLGHKALAVNLSDLAAMGAEPAWVTLALALPEVNEVWLEAFSCGFAALASRAGVSLVGGDTTRGPLTLTLQVHGFVPRGSALRRDGAQPGDRICVSGRLGDAALGLRLLQGEANLSEPERSQLIDRLQRPQPRLALGQALRGLASAAIDISDGLLADLGHILQASGVGARLQLARLPLSDAVRRTADWGLPLAGGDDYELCFTLPPAELSRLWPLSEQLGLAISEIGEITAAPGLVCEQADATIWRPSAKGYDHFASHE
ncbi:thiamine-phosphate kinase [endosymbiont of Ridgeia piscesae]|jgi:thiamine-monophosphate kinase|uniref:Thiamine-monophosphate kinase n=1 Tax=endosymbiont of Ridgeia piscesae TaxID=54398 RepID=A0A0T5Z8B8_9GAMM|nr:thiamine-phosphate kinase [endosymbiont of Ridgeia piscesae]KRT55717.1 thiamine-phosphate kinase [endosymbiont of Ridgeia piscesae]KRT59143.1 thiamine-phosphate kinase [endosymbiont of Ridgeia piscesae]